MTTRSRGVPMHQVTSGAHDAELREWDAARVLQREMARRLGCSQGVVCTRLAFLRGGWAVPAAVVTVVRPPPQGRSLTPAEIAARLTILRGRRSPSRRDLPDAGCVPVGPGPKPRPPVPASAEMEEV